MAHISGCPVATLPYPVSPPQRPRLSSLTAGTPGFLLIRYFVHLLLTKDSLETQKAESKPLQSCWLPVTAWLQGIQTSDLGQSGRHPVPASSSLLMMAVTSRCGSLRAWKEETESKSCVGGWGWCPRERRVRKQDGRGECAQGHPSSLLQAALEPRLHLEVYWVGVGLCGPHQPGIDCELWGGSPSTGEPEVNHLGEAEGKSPKEGCG